MSDTATSDSSRRDRDDYDGETEDEVLAGKEEWNVLTYLGAATIHRMVRHPRHRGVAGTCRAVRPRHVDLLALRTCEAPPAAELVLVGARPSCVAWDWRYANPGPGRAAAEEAMAFTIDHRAFGIQAIQDYVARRIWRSSRGGAGPAWTQQKPATAWARRGRHGCTSRRIPTRRCTSSASRRA